MTIVHEAFRGADGSAGVLLRADSASGTRFLTCFVEPGDTLYRVAIRVVHPGRPDQWTSLEMADHVGGTIATLGAREVAPGSIPSYADILVVEDLVAAGQDGYEWNRLDESTLGTLHAALRRGEEGEVDGLDGAPIAATPYVLELEGQATYSFWVADGQVVVSDWAGAFSYRVADLDAALEGSSKDVATHAEAWVRGPGSR
ncbi:hypothetical protein ACPYO6_15805 [Georgenia sp. Z1344]|uniref:hypothetical protein n=1 Tax=Georgenia sp. Z1344 TaxID=3416706 RepID=UPI003CF53AB1